MIRPIAIELALFLLPFVLYVLFLIGTRVGVLHPGAWTSRRLSSLVLTALILMLAGFFLFVQFDHAPPGATYVPAHMENGKFVPGEIK